MSPRSINRIEISEEEREREVCKIDEATKMSEDFIIEGVIQGTKMKMLVDTGAVISLLSQKAIDKIGDKIKRKPAEYKRIVAINKSETEIEAMVTEKIKIGNFEAEEDLHIVPGTSYEILLGRTFISKYISKIDLREKTMKFRDKEGNVFIAEINSMETGTRKEKVTAAARLAQKTIIEPGKEMMIEVYPSNDIVAKELKFEANEWSKNVGIEMESQVVSGYTNTMKILAKNVTDKRKALFHTRKIGQFHEIDQKPIEIHTIHVNRMKNWGDRNLARINPAVPTCEKAKEAETVNAQHVQTATEERDETRAVYTNKSSTHVDIEASAREEIRNPQTSMSSTKNQREGMLEKEQIETRKRQETKKGQKVEKANELDDSNEKEIETYLEKIEKENMTARENDDIRAMEEISELQVQVDEAKQATAKNRRRWISVAKIILTKPQPYKERVTNASNDVEPVKYEHKWNLMK